MIRKTRLPLILCLLLAMILCLSACSKAVEDNGVGGETPPETTEESIYVNASGIRAQDDFYLYVNDELLKEKTKEAGVESWNQFMDVYNHLQEQIFGIGEDLLEDTSFDQGSTEEVVSALYQTALDKEKREEAGLGSLAPYLEELRAADSIPSYLSGLARIRKELGKTSLLDFSLLPDPQTPTSYALYLEEPIMLVEKVNLEHASIVEAMKEYVKDLLSLSGTPEEESEEWSKEVVSFHKQLGELTLSRDEAVDFRQITHITTLEELQSSLSNIDLLRFLEDCGQDGFINWVQKNPAMTSFVNQYLVEENLELLKTYSIVCLLNDFAPYLTLDYADSNAKFNRLHGLSEDQRAWNAVQLLAEQEVGELYAKKYFSPAKKEMITDLVEEVIEAYREHLQRVDWLGEESRQIALNKLDSFILKVGYPESYTSYVKGIIQSPDEGGIFIENAILSMKHRAEAELIQGREEVKLHDWDIAPHIYNAYYDHMINSVNFPAAILQAPFFDDKASRAENIGGIGSIIAHEITHAFDDNGSLFDDKRVFRDWWSEEDRKGFDERKQKFVKFFGAVEVLPGQRLDGEYTLNENIADTGAISVIASIFEGDPVSLREMFTTNARVWATQRSQREQQFLLKRDNHAPPKVRVNRVLSLTDAFYETFHVKPGDKMYVAPEDRFKMF